MNKKVIIAILIAAFAAAVYMFESGEKDPNVTANEAPSAVKGR